MYLINFSASKELVHNQQINLIMDEVVVDSLNVSFYDTDNEGVPLIDKDELKENIVNEAAIGLLGNIDDSSKGIIESRIMFLIYLDKDGYYCYRNGKWNDKVKYDSDMHTALVDQVSKNINKMVGDKYKTLIPYNDGEDYKNSIYKYSCLVFYEQFNKYYCFSGARINFME